MSQLQMEFPAEPQEQLPGFPESDKVVRGDLAYITAFVYLGRPEHKMLVGGSEHSDLVGKWQEEKTNQFIDAGWEPSEADSEAWKILESCPLVMGHVCVEWVDGEVHGTWAVFFSDWGRERMPPNQPLKLEALAALKKNDQYDLHDVKEGDDYVYNGGWYKGDG